MNKLHTYIQDAPVKSENFLVDLIKILIIKLWFCSVKLNYFNEHRM